MPPRRDALTEQQLVRDLWQQVSARIDSSGALRAFLTQKIDDCGQTVAFEAFDLVRQVLNPDGFVRRAHKSADQNLGAAITMPESPWSAAGSIVDRQWDFNNAWMSGRRYWPALDNDVKLEHNSLKKFCTEELNTSIVKEDRHEHIDYKDHEDHDKFRPMPKLDIEQQDIPIINKIPDDNPVRPIRRWETYCSSLKTDAWTTVFSGTSWGGAPSGSKTKLKKDALLKELAKYNFNGKNMTVAQLQDVLRLKTGNVIPTTIYSTVDDLIGDNQPLETYWKVALRSDEWAHSRAFKNYDFDEKHTICSFFDRPDLILEVAYFSTDSGLFKKKVVFCEIDGDDKTAKKSTKKEKGEEGASDDVAEDTGQKKTQPKDPLKLAYKLMTSTNSQLSLQPDTYHIRSNWTVYNDYAIDRSLTETTGIELPEFADLIATYNKQRNSQDFHNLHRAIHLVHHMFVAHVKIAFQIYMQTVHDIDMRSLDAKDKRFQNHCFYVNFDCSHIPDELKLEHDIPQSTKEWLEDHLMLHTRICIKTYNRDLNTDEWKIAPVLNAGSERSAMRDWSAGIARAPLPLFPYEKRSTVSVTCATIQRVDIHTLITIVEAASKEALTNYYEATTLKHRKTTIIINSLKLEQEDILRRQFPDRCFLTRSQQYNRTSMWNDYPARLRKRRLEKENDLLDFSWGYENPVLTRRFTEMDDVDNASEDAWRLWDQLDVRMYYFNKAMNKPDRQKTWKDAARGMWYLQDYIAFFDALRKLVVAPIPVMEGAFTTLETPPPIANAAIMATYKLRMRILSKYAFLVRIKHGTPSVWVQDAEDEDLHYYYQKHPTANDRHHDRPEAMPKQSDSENRAYHIFSILSWFFDCRDGGACRWRWEDYLLEYFGAKTAGVSAFGSFEFTQKQTDETACEYFNQPWFLMTFFMELNFRNAIAQMHCKLFETSAHTQEIAGEGLQKKAKELYNRQHSLLNTRARCAGLQGVSAGLSWQKNAERNCLRNLLLSSLDDTLPGLDPQLASYLQKFNAPNAALFLRMIEVSNVLALRELALQHKLASQAPPAASKRQSSPAASKLEQRLGWFEPAVQSEIRHLMYCVERDDSVFTAAPVVHPTKAIVLEEELMRKWVRQTLGVHQHLHTLRCPLDVKFHLFTAPETYRVFMQLFCTKTQLDNSHTQRPVLFVLLQIYLVAEVLKGARQEYDTLLDNTAVNKVQRTNNALESLHVASRSQQCHTRYTISVVDGEDNVPCTPGSSLATWPLRDQNLWCKPSRTPAPDKRVEYAAIDTLCTDLVENDITFQIDPQSVEMLLTYPEEEELLTRSMTQKELRRWLLLACARPGPCQYVREDDGRYTAGAKKHAFIMQDCAVRQEAEWPHASATGRQRDTMIATVSSFHVSEEHRLEVCLCDDDDTHVFFETVEAPEDGVPMPFPQYIKDIITQIPNRKLIYVPRVFASHLRKTERLHDKLYLHEGKCWRMACVGYRAWAWKRLMIKSIFFDTLTKVVTRSSVLLSLLQVPDNDENNQIKRYREMLKDTKDTFGTLTLKLDSLKRNLVPKKIQNVLTIFRKKCRSGEVNGRRINFYEPDCKVSKAQRQVEWCQYYNAHKPSEETCRFLSIDKRIHQALLPFLTPNVLKDHQVLQYNSYLFTRDTSKDEIVSFKGNIYVKFPMKYAVLKSGMDYYTGDVKLIEEESYFATCWDCRTYSCLKPNYVHAADSADMIRILTKKAAPSSLFSKIIVNNGKWPSTPHDDPEACKYIQLDTVNHRAYFLQKHTAFIEHSANAIRERQQEYMFTLPDTFVENELDLNNLPSMDPKGEWNDVQFIEQLKNVASDDDKCKLWNNLRNSSRYISTKATPDPKGKLVVEKVLDTGDASFQNPFKDIMATIRRRILPKPNEDT